MRHVMRPQGPAGPVHPHRLRQSILHDVTRHSGAGRVLRVRLRPMSLFESGESSGSVSLRRLGLMATL